MTALGVLLAGAAVGHGLAKWLRLPAIPLLLLAGFSLGLLGILPERFLEEAVVLGVTFLVFAAGVELTPRRVGHQARAALRVGAGQFALLGGIGFAAAAALGFDRHTAFYLAVALTASSTLVVVRLLQRRQQLFEPFGRLVIGVLLLQDLLVILLIPVLTRSPQGIGQAALGLLGALALVALALIGLRWFVPLLLRSFERDEETLLLTVLALLFLFIGLADLMGLPIVAGAFLAGVSLSAFPTSGIVRPQLGSLADFFAAVFFTALGGLLILPTPTEVAQALVLAALVVVVTPPLVAFLAERAGLSARSGIESGLPLAQTSELSLIVGLQGLVFGQIAADAFTIIALVTVMTMVLTPFIASDPVTRSLKALHPLRRGLPSAPPPGGHVLLLGCGDNGMPLLEMLVSRGRDTFVVDDDAVVIGWLREGEVPCLWGDASDPRILRGAGADRARVIVSTMRRAGDNVQLLSAVHDVPVLVRVFEPEDAEAIRALGGTPILYSRAAADDFLAWFEKTRPRPASLRDGTE